MSRYRRMSLLSGFTLLLVIAAGCGTAEGDRRSILDGSWVVERPGRDALRLSFGDGGQGWSRLRVPGSPRDSTTFRWESDRRGGLLRVRIDHRSERVGDFRLLVAPTDSVGHDSLPAVLGRTSSSWPEDLSSASERSGWVPVTMMRSGGSTRPGADRPDGAHRSPRRLIGGARLPSYSETTLDGDTIAIRDYRSQVLLLNVWATWCPACRREMPSLQALHGELSPEGLRVVGVSIDEGPNSEAKVRRFLDEYGITYTILHDPNGDIRDTYQVIGIPTTYLVDRQGRVVKRWLGEVDFDAREVREVIQRTLVGRRESPG